MIKLKRISRVVLPSDIALTPRVMLGAAKKLPTALIAEMVEGLIDLLDCRDLDSDLEADTDFEPESELAETGCRGLCTGPLTGFGGR